MISRSTYAILCFCLLTPQFVHAQANENATPASRERRMYEEIEILRRILDQTFTALVAEAHPQDRQWLRSHAPAANRFTTLHDVSAGDVWVDLGGKPETPYVLKFAPDASGRIVRTMGAHSSPLLDGVYLKGYGVIYSAVAPFPVPASQSEPTKPAGKPVSQWEQVRRELYGAKPAAEQPPAEPRRRSITEMILRVLAENGQHFTQLSENEQVTVAITFRGTGACSACHGEGSNQPTTTSQPVYPSPPKPLRSSSAAPFNPMETRSSSDSAISATRSTGVPTDAQGLSLLGDLHMKQGRYQEAAEAYQKALQQKESSTLYRKLAQTMLAQADQDGSRQSVEKARQFLESALRAEKPASPPATASVPLHPKLILSAPKKLLDQVGAGKISFGEFQKAVTVQHVNFNPPPKEPAKP